ncbi:DUF2683 family protein [Candidatus Woesearchaeota archaeon]|nr:DUF2683 family protein [Candidatus Woesearchaeota archaeon]
MVYARVFLNEYANRVLNVIKAQFGFNDKSKALNKFIELHGEEVLGREAKEEYVKKIIGLEKEHFKRYGRRKMGLQELNALCGVK